MPNVVFVHMFHAEIRKRINAQFAHNLYVAVAHIMATSGAPFLSFPGELRIGQSAPALQYPIVRLPAQQVCAQRQFSLFLSPLPQLNGLSTPHEGWNVKPSISHN